LEYSIKLIDTIGLKLVIPVLFLNACQNQFVIVPENDSCPKHKEISATKEIDYMLAANKMIDSLIADAKVKQQTSDKRIRIFINSVVNNTDKLINTSEIHKTLRKRLQRSGKFILTDNQDTAMMIISGKVDEIDQITKKNPCIKKYQEFSLDIINTIDSKLFWSEKKQY
jgi:PBP1b-binding outer membrane lipoprotein LpoB